ncbi:MAG: hypothetical protein RJB15_164 [Pseudomonadota bacterium]|jgi:isoquinoline 1-oxidoreductase beta subunit
MNNQDFSTKFENPTKISRRRALQLSSGLVLGMHIQQSAFSQSVDNKIADLEFRPNAFLRIANDGSITVISKHIEMGQGISTGLATLLAEELDADWKTVKVLSAPAEPEIYKNLFWGIQGTGGSNSVANSYEQMRKAGATARAMLVSAAAKKWNVPASEITVSNSVISHPRTKKSARFGELVAEASLMTPPSEVSLKDSRNFSLIGKNNVNRKDSEAKTDGTAIFTQDVKLPGMMVAMIAHAPRFGAVVKSFDATRTKEIPDVISVIQIPSINGKTRAGVAVLAKTTWAAKRGRDALSIQWDDSNSFKMSSEAIFQQYRESVSKPGLIARQDGNAVEGFSKATKFIDAEYTFPYLAHAAMEPLNCVVSLNGDKCEIWNGEQWQTADQAQAAHVLGIPAKNVTINALYAGGSFGRRANPFSDYVLEAVVIAKSAREQGLNGPIKMVWTREDDMTGGYFRPLNLHSAKLALDDKGNLISWKQRIVGQSIFKGTAFESIMIKNGIDHESVVGADDLPYDIPNLLVDLYTPDNIPVPIQWYRSVGHTHTAFSTECLVDEAAAAAKQDPYLYRRKLLAKHSRLQNVLDLAASKSGWNQPLTKGAAGTRRGRGIAVHKSFNTYVAQVVEVTVKDSGDYKVDRVVCAVDCGVPINPDVIKAQMEGGIAFALSMALYGDINLKDGYIEQTNFHQYKILRMQEMPKVDVHIVNSNEKPTGVGEPGVPPLAPALANALFTATGKRLRNMPFGNTI